ncbi:MAG: MotA/TolQ/ExbB proton channel family protein [Acidobacteria bacterium]|nr:MotA/TolQ/ExbB proton channel family protein [Acidobacteriota bacterium]
METFRAGGFVVLPIVVVAVLAAAVAIERAWWLLRRERTLAAREALRAGGLEAARDAAPPGSAAAALVEAASAGWSGSRAELEERLEQAAGPAIRHLESRMWVLGAASHVAPALGFVGALLGMLRSFGVIAGYGLSRPEAIGPGFRAALIATAAGLAVSVASLAAYSLLTARISRQVAALEDLAEALVGRRFAGRGPA